MPGAHRRDHPSRQLLALLLSFSLRVSNVPRPRPLESGHEEAAKDDEAKEGNPRHRKPTLMMAARKQNVKDAPSAAPSPPELTVAALPAIPFPCAGCRGACGRARRAP